MRNKSQIKKWLYGFGTAVGFVLYLGIFGASSYAATALPGCYNYTESTKTYAVATCTSKQMSDSATANKQCFLSKTTSTGTSAMTVTDCTTITVADGSTSAAGSAGAAADADASLSNPLKTGGPDESKLSQCGKGEKTVKTGFDFGCRGDSYGGDQLNPIVDVAFAIYRFLSAGVGIIAVGSIIVAGIQYSASRGNPQATQAAITRISNTLIGLVIYIFIYAIANYLVPGGIFT